MTDPKVKPPTRIVVTDGKLDQRLFMAHPIESAPSRRAQRVGKALFILILVAALAFAIAIGPGWPR